MTLLRPCPFCGGEDSRQLTLDAAPHGSGTAFSIHCGGCAAEGPWGKTEASARAWWNGKCGNPSGPVRAGVGARRARGEVRRRG
jgi:Lar family restriction alleviation protein